MRTSLTPSWWRHLRLLEMEYNEFIQQKTEHEHITIYTTQCGLSLPTTANNNNNQSIVMILYAILFIWIQLGLAIIHIHILIGAKPLCQISQLISHSNPTLLLFFCPLHFVHISFSLNKLFIIIQVFTKFLSLLKLIKKFTS